MRLRSAIACKLTPVSARRRLFARLLILPFGRIGAQARRTAERTPTRLSTGCEPSHPAPSLLRGEAADRALAPLRIDPPKHAPAFIAIDEMPSLDCPINLARVRYPAIPS